MRSARPQRMKIGKDRAGATAGASSRVELDLFHPTPHRRGVWGQVLAVLNVGSGNVARYDLTAESVLEIEAPAAPSRDG